MKSVEELFYLAASSEKTPELRDFWLARYRQLLANVDNFLIHQKTFDLFELQSIARPSTPIAEVVLKGSLKEDNTISVSDIQDVVYTGVRFLDALLDVIPFDEIARAKVSEYRKIGLGIFELEQYITLHKNSNKVELVDTIGDLFSNLAYRASESLAEEKGSPTSWGLLKKILRPKVFEKWINSETGEVYDGLYLTSVKSQEEVLNSQISIITRRNSSLLLLPQTKQWSKWSDREMVRPIQSQPVQQQQSIQTNQELSPLPEFRTIQDEKNEAGINPLEVKSEFEVGEIVKIISKTSPYVGKVGQVTGVKKVEHEDIFLLSGSNEDISKIEWRSGDLRSIESETLISELDKNAAIVINIIFLNKQRQKVMVTKSGNLPSFSYQEKTGMSLRQIITAGLADQMNQFIDVLNYDIVGTTFDSLERIFYLGVNIRITSQLKGIDWKEITTNSFSNYDKLLIDQSQQKVNQELKIQQRIDTLQKQNEELKLAMDVKSVETGNFEWLRNTQSLVAFSIIELTEGSKIRIGAEQQNQLFSRFFLEAVELKTHGVQLVLKLLELTLNATPNKAGMQDKLISLTETARGDNDTLALEILNGLLHTFF
jgi:Ribonucleotide reductase, barrel domain